MSRNNPGAHFNTDYTAVEIERLTVQDKDVAREAQRWTAGERGSVIEDSETLAAADLSAFVSEAIKIGSHALSAVGQAQDAKALQQMLKDVGEKAADSTTKLTESTERATKAASVAMSKAANDAKKAIVEADATSRKEFTQAVASAKKDVTAELQKIFGGDNPELMDKLQPVLDKFGNSIEATLKAGTAELITKAAKQFDPSDPTSPMARHTATLDAQQKAITTLIGDNHKTLTEKVDAVVTALKVQEARKAASKRSPEKGFDYEDAMGGLLQDIAAGLGDEYVDTRNTTGVISRCKMGDGVLSVDGGKTQVVIEMTAAGDRKWGPYFDGAERNREAAASLGIVPTADCNGGQSVRVMGTRRIVLTYDPQSGDPALLRTVVMLLRASALAASSRRGAEEISTAEEKITEAIAQLDRIDKVKKLASSIQKNANKIENDCTGINAAIQRLLADALAALSEVPDDEPHEAAVAS
ncbi:Fis family transcriptional regulator [Mycolicibacterium peregrinum]|uniref:hypothetical protein n=1 Tax=Mycolicibacterium peregrinum TaxID=43304 RepID=UPI0006D7BFCC|nr:hypothetical protein [Mycolicibacterium peregrinum]MCV7202050.1 Fis family transcriptional regulator [Mycolicibacterium peregrinum]ORW61314.1 Fis family transcriptional regulator [Mycolicibacterium peregrinum]